MLNPPPRSASTKARPDSSCAWVGSTPIATRINAVKPSRNTRSNLCEITVPSRADASLSVSWERSSHLTIPRLRFRSLRQRPPPYLIMIYWKGDRHEPADVSFDHRIGGSRWHRERLSGKLFMGPSRLG